MRGGFLAKLAEGAPIPIFCLCGDGERSRTRSLAYSARLRVVSSPRHAAVLVAVGALPPELHTAAQRVHDQLPVPRGVVHWAANGALPFANAAQVAGNEDPTAAVLATFRRLIATGATSPLFGPRRNPVEWQGKGPHGQGGKGMMGGTPYGRSMAMTGDDKRDGLALDRLSIELGPFIPWLPPGLRLSVTLQGDLVESLALTTTAFRTPDLADVFIQASQRAVPLADVELARARHHLEATADLLDLLGLAGLAARAYRLAKGLAPDAASHVRALHRRLQRSLSLRLATRGIGQLPSEHLVGAGLAARAAGRRDDVRLADPAYTRLGFEPLLREAGDAEARWQLRLAEAAQSLQLARRAGEARRDPAYALESPRGPLSPTADSLLGDALVQAAPGWAWDELVTSLVSLDLDPAMLASATSEKETAERDRHDGQAAAGRGSGHHPMHQHHH